MNRLLKFFHEFVNPHCDHCDVERAEKKVCSSCETLKTQLQIANFEKQQLLNSILSPVVAESFGERRDIPAAVEPIVPRHVPWNVRRKMLEEEDKHKMNLMREASKNMATVQSKSTEELEKELGIAGGS